MKIKNWAIGCKMLYDIYRTINLIWSCSDGGIDVRDQVWKETGGLIMDHVRVDQVRQFRLNAHHLDKWFQEADVADIVGACGFQNSPPGAWEIFLHSRIKNLKQNEMIQMLEVEKWLLQAWSIRGVPLVFPVSDSDAFLSALVPNPDEPWVYTRGIQLALDYLQMPFEILLNLLKQLMPNLDGQLIKGKALLDQTLAEWMLPLLPNDKRDLWTQPSMYGDPEKQTVGGAVVSFLLRPCSCLGLVVFGKRAGISPTFTSYRSWIGHPLEKEGNPEQKLVRKYLHCYGPSSIDGFMAWLGCAREQAERIWFTVIHEIEPVSVSGKTRYIRSLDKELLLSPIQSERKVHLLGGHDPYLGMPDRDVILDNKSLQKQVWQTVSNPGAVLWQGKVAGTWKSSKKDRGLDVDVALWDGEPRIKKEVMDLVDGYALFRQLKLNRITFQESHVTSDA